MTHADFSITYNFLDSLATYNEKAGLLNSFFVVHIGGAMTVGCTAIIDTLWHLAAGVIKVATGIFATPLAYFTKSNSAKEWSWSTAGKHFLQATNHALGLLVSVPTTFFFSPKAALDVLFPQKVELEELKISYIKLFNIV